MTIEEVRKALEDDQIVAALRAEENERVGRALAWQAGRKDGEARGEAKGRVNTLLELIAVRYGKPEPTPQTEATVRAATDRQVREWIARICAAGSVAELLAGPSGSERNEH